MMNETNVHVLPESRVNRTSVQPLLPPARLGELLVEAGLFSHDGIEVHAAEAHRAGLKLGEYLTSKHLITRGDLYEVLQKLLRSITIQTVRDLPEWDVVLNDAGQPLGGQDRPKGTLLLALSNEVASGARRAFLLTTEAEMGSHRYASLYAKVTAEGYAIRGKLLAEDPSILDVVMSEWGTRRMGAPGKNDASSSALHTLWDKIIYDAYKLGASDIHLSAAMGRGEVRFRIHGDLEPQPIALTEEDALQLASSMYNTMVDKGSTGDGFNPRLTQDAVVTRSFPEGSLRLRYACLPVEPSGVNVTLRLIPIGVTAKPKTAAQLGYSADQCDTLDRIFSRSSGLILFLGTTGSGKSTSMANMLMQLVKERPGKILRTVEEPVETRIPGASQTSFVRSKKEAGEEKSNVFVDVMRALMRADPDYLMVGEIRDPDTAGLAIQAVRSGHLCVSTLHADGAPLAYDRLEGMGIPRAEIASVGLVAGLIYQRLVPVLCPHCKVSTLAIKKDTTGEYSGVLRRLDHYLDGKSSETVFFRNAMGCAHCDKRGIVGRTVCAEILVPKPSMLRAIAEGDSRSIWKAWREGIDATRPEVMTGRTAFEHALWKMCEGVVSPLDVEKEFRYLDEQVFE